MILYGMHRKMFARLSINICNVVSIVACVALVRADSIRINDQHNQANSQRSVPEADARVRREANSYGQEYFANIIDQASSYILGEDERDRRDILNQIEEASSRDLGNHHSLGASFSQGFIDLGSRNPVEEGAATLAFVFDTTGSMYDDLKQVIEGAGKILRTILEKFDRPIHNFVLVPFNDPDIGPMTVTTNPEEFEASLRELFIQGGGDCPEQALGAIKMALEAVLPSSYIYVFTDARAKDNYKLEQVLTLIQKKQSQVVFVMTGDCANHTHRTFETIASTSSGQVFHLNKGDVNQVLSFVRLSLESRKVNLLSVDFEGGSTDEEGGEGRGGGPGSSFRQPGEDNIELLVDNTLKEFTVSVSGNRPNIQIIGPGGKDLEEEEQLEDLLTLQNVKIVGVKEPKPGRYNITVGSDSKYTVRATGLSSIDFEHGFSLEPTTNFKEIYHRPMAGGKSYVIVKPTELTEFGDLYRLQLISLDGKVLHDLPLKRLPGYKPIYNGTSFISPDEPFNVKIFGRDQSGYQFERISPTAVSAQLPFPPDVSSKNMIFGYFDRPVSIICHIQTLVPFSLSWQKDGQELTPSQDYPQSAEVEYVIKSPTRDDEGRYTCLASNIAGSTSSNIFLDMKEPPPLIAVPHNASLAPDQPGRLSCKVTSTAHYNVTWYKYKVKGQVQDFFGKTETIGEFISVADLDRNYHVEDGSLVLPTVGREEDGWFRCTAANEGGSTSREVYVSVQTLPQISVVPEAVAFQGGDTVSVRCISRGFPPPKVTWRHKGLTLPSYGRVMGDASNTLVVREAEPDDEGIYICHAESSAGTVEVESVLTFIESPRVIAVEKEVLISGGETAALHCYAEGTPTPIVKWFKDELEIRPMSFIQVADGHLQIQSVQESDSGTYSCVATNVAGVAQDEVELKVGSPPTFVQEPANTIIDIGGSGVLSCYGVGVPPPVITWKSADGKMLPRRFQQDDAGNLRVTGVRIEDEGDYKCLLVNDYGSEIRTVSLSVSGLLPPLIVAPSSTTISAKTGEPANFPCTVIMANPAPHISWYFDNYPIKVKEGIFIKDDGTLKIFSVKSQHEGEYKCVVTNIAGNSSQTLHLDVLVAPSVRSGKHEEIIGGLEGETVKLRCPVRADPRPSFSWQKNGQPIIYQKRMRVLREGTLVIHALQVSDEGTYVCTAINSAGATNLAMVLNVNVPPVIENDEEVYVASEGEVIDIPCRGQGSPTPTSVWLNEEQTLLYDFTLPNGTLRLIAGAESEGYYECIVTNDAGTARRRVQLIVSKDPEIIPNGDEYLDVNAGDDIQLPCEAFGYPQPDIVWKKDGLLIETTQQLRPSTSSLLLKEMTPELAATYTCAASNRAGTAHKHFHLSVLYAPHVNRNAIPPPDMAVVEGGRLSLPCPAQAEPLPERQWTKDGLTLKEGDGLSITHTGTVEVGTATPKHSGFYRCTLSNALGHANIDYDVKVLIPPKLSGRGSLEKSSPVVVEGEAVSIHCPVNAVPIPTITWLKDGLSIFSTRDRADMTHIVIEDNGQTLHILDATIDDKGLYRCIAENIAGVIETTIPLEVLVPPQFKDFFHNPSVIASVGENIDMSCDVSGDPEPQVQWWRDGSPLYSHVEGNGRQVHIPHARPGDAGYYSCHASNSAGTNQRNFTVSVLVPPTVEEGAGDSSTSVNAPLGTDTILRCRVSGWPQPEISWTRGNQFITQLLDVEYILEDNGSVLRLLNVQPETAGVYICNATNSIGSAVKSVNVTVMTPPRSIGGNTSGEVVEVLSVVVGEDVLLSCRVEAHPPPVFTWLRDGRQINPSTRQHFTADHEMLLTELHASDSGEYVCVATNPAGSTEQQFSVNVLVPVQISSRGGGHGSGGLGNAAESPALQEVLVDMPFSVYCPAYGSPEPTIQWSKDGEPLFGNSQRPGIDISDSGRRLMVSNAEVTNSGDYVCLAQNKGGSDTATYSIKVLDPPEINRNVITSFSKLEGETFTLECRVKGDPLPSLVWELDGVAVQDLEIIGLTENRLEDLMSEIKIENSSVVHAGTYTCIASSVAGSDELGYHVKVATAPQLDDEITQRHFTAKVNRPATLTCNIMASPEPDLLWFKNNIPINEDSENLHLSLGGRDLKVLRVTEEDAGNYTCLAVNEAGALSVNFTLDVHVPPRIMEVVEKEIHVIVGETAVFYCPAHSSPEPSILWMKDSQILQDSFTVIEPRKLVLDDATKDDDGRYICLAANEAGTVEEDFILHVMVPPRLLDEANEAVMEKTVIVNRPVTVTCFIVADPPPVITWYKNGRPLSMLTAGLSLDGSNKQVSISQAQPEDSGNYTCEATNQAGTTTLTTRLQVLTPPQWNEYSSHEEEIVGKSGGDLELICDVEGSPPPSILWLKDGQLYDDSPTDNDVIGNHRILKLKNLEDSNSGIYSCITSNSAGTAEFDFHVNVQTPPSLTNTPLTKRTVLVNRAVTLECPVEGTPHPDISWLINDRLLIGPSQFIRLTQAGRQLHLLRVLRANNGTVSCIAKNSVGELRLDYELEVMTPPVILPTPVSRRIKVQEGDLVKLSCNVEGYPKPQVAWVAGSGSLLTEEELYAAGLEITQGGETLTLLEVNGEHEGRYTCIASNAAGSTEDSFIVQVSLPPEIEYPEDGTTLTVTQGASVDFSCVVDARPQATIKWYKNDSPLQVSRDPFVHITAGGERLTFLRSLQHHSGNYTCIATSAVGKDQLSYDLTVMVPPVIIGDFRSNSLDGAETEEIVGVVGGDLELECYTLGNPRPNIHWTKDGNDVIKSDRIQVAEEEQLLLIEDITSDDSGRYTCNATSVSGNAAKDFTVLIHNGPRIILPVTTNIDAVVNQPLVLKCDVESSLTSAITWARHGRTLSTFADPNIQILSNGGELNLRHVRPNDGGTFTCIAVNSAGQDMLTYSITVLVPPVIDRSKVKTRHMGIVGQSIRLNCNATGSPDPILEWNKDNTTITNDHPHYVLHGGGRSIEIVSLSEQDNGVVTCSAINTAGQDTLNYTLHVMVPPSLNEDAALDVTVMEGESITLECPVTAQPEASVLWSVGGRILGIGGRGNLEETGNSLRLVRAGHSNTGVYTCSATNIAGVLDVPINLQVLVPPQISGGSRGFQATEEQVTVLEGGHVTLKCLLTKGHPTPTRKWFVGTDLRDPNHPVVGSGEQLVISSAKPGDTNTYHCVAINDAGQDTKVYKLLVHTPPRINTELLPGDLQILTPGGIEAEFLPPNGRPQQSSVSTTVTVNEEETVTLLCPITGDPEPRRLWYRGSQAVEPTSRVSLKESGSKLTIFGVNERDAGSYVCIGVNPAGEAQITTNLIVIVRPEIVGENEQDIAVVQGKKTVLECKIEIIQSSTVRGPRRQIGHNITWSKDGLDLVYPPKSSDLIQEKEPIIYGDRSDISENFTYEYEVTNYWDYNWDEDYLDSSFLSYGKQNSIQNNENPTSDVELIDLTGLRNQNASSWFHISPDNTKLTIVKASEQDEGRYVCRISNQAGFSEMVFKVDTLVPPDIDAHTGIKTHEAALGEPVVFECNAHGDPPPKVHWYRGEDLVQSQSRMQLIENNHVLIITSVQENDEGNYKCLASNLAGVTEETFELVILVPPSIRGNSERSEVSVVSGQSTSLTCDAEGNPKPQITWTFKDETLINDDNIILEDSTLVIDRVTVDHKGQYKCEATNAVGREVKTFQLEVTEAPIIAGGNNVETVTVVEGAEATLHCIASGQPTPRLHWTKDGHTVLFGERRNVTWGGKTLRIEGVLREDAGTYSCTATNDGGTQEKEYRLQVLQVPYLNKDPDDMVAVTGEVIVLECNFEGHPEPKVSWYHNGQPLSNPSELTASNELQLSPVKPEHHGNYSCVGANEAGTGNHTFTLTVQTPPQVSIHPSSEVVVVEGRSATLSCQTQGQPAPSLTWLKGYQPIQNNQDMQITGGGHDLYFPSVSPELADTYICTARSSAGIAHAHAKLIVQEPPSVSASESEIVVIEGGEAVLNCQVKGHPVPDIQWTRPDLGGKPVDPKDSRIQISGGSIVIVPVAMEDSGRYECMAYNTAGKSTDTLTLTVHSPPFVEEPLEESVVIIRGETLSLSCSASGHPPPQLTWLREGRVLYEKPQTTLKNNGQLVMEKIKSSDTGLYTCLVVNEAGRLYREIFVEVHVPPRITSLPRSTDVTRGEEFSLECEATGTPVPSITWLLNGTKVGGVLSYSNGYSRLTVERASKTDEGTYTCVAENVAGHRKAVAPVRVKVPPIIMNAPEEMTVLELDSVIMTCVSEGDPMPDTTWIKEGHSIYQNDRVHFAENGSLVINSSVASDAGEYKCIVSNDAGAAEASAHLIVHTAPLLTRPPISKVVDVGESIVFDCEAEGSPEPIIEWSKTPGVVHSRFITLTNGSLQLIAAQMEDEGQVICQAYNDLGEDLAKAELSVRVHGMWNSWMPWSSCSVSCGPGQQERQRLCNQPEPRHGGSQCPGPGEQYRPCRPQPCPVDGSWSAWDPFGECSLSCGDGVRVRRRYCTAPAPLYGGKTCPGQGNEQEPCHPRDCPVNGNWSLWSSWSECSTYCGSGLRQRTRLCDSPTPVAGGKECSGDDLEVTPCESPPCLLDGSWASWGSWSSCSVSCGGGIQQRKRVCDDPKPSNGGRYCPGSDTLEDYCNLDACPINGGWSSWSAWGTCTATCGEGQRRRFRKCSNPAPSPDGRACTGSDSDTETCNPDECPVSGSWSMWGDWSSCSVSCGQGNRVRTRKCNTTTISLFFGNACPGDQQETTSCEGTVCSRLPIFAQGSLTGALNGEDLGIVNIRTNISELGMQRTLTASINPLIPKHATWMKPLLSLLSPVYWLTAYEINGAANGHTLTHGYFTQKAHVAFTTGETVDIIQNVRGVDSSGTLQLDVELSGDVPAVSPGTFISLQPYSEDYVQTGKGSLFATSTRTFLNEGYPLPYAWNKTINYDPSQGDMPYLVQTLYANGLGSSYSTTRSELDMIVSVNIAPGSHSDRCPSGFTLEPSGPFCRDNNECLLTTSRCSHSCENTVGRYFCTCPEGYTIGMDGYTCQDVDECRMIGICGPREHCENTPGSYSCIYTCSHGFKRKSSGTSCEDINECKEQPDVCDQTCLNLIGGYRCDCRRGFRLVGQNKCKDIDECSKFRKPCSHQCENTVGSFKCSCPEGYNLLPNGRCKDVNECALYQHDCLDEQECRNTEGSFECTTLCPKGLRQASSIQATNGTCTDIDECSEQIAGCHFTQVCENTWGSFRCMCPRGFKSSGPGQPCIDVDECELYDQCQHRCQNTFGSYNCHCPPGYRLSVNRRTCNDINECLEQNVRCGSDQQCFNLRGSYKCIYTPCPSDYFRDSKSGRCILDCRLGTCPPGVGDANILTFKTASLPAGIVANQDLVRLVAYDQYGSRVTQTRFGIIENNTGVQFRIRLENGKGILQTLQPLIAGREYKMIVEAKSYDERQRLVKYSTRFVIFLHISEYPY